MGEQVIRLSSHPEAPLSTLAELVPGGTGTLREVD